MERYDNDLTGKKIKFLRDVEYAEMDDLNSNDNDSYASGVVFDGELNDGLNVDEFKNFAKYLEGIGFVKNNFLTIPEGTTAEVVYDNSGNDLELKINDRLNIVIVNNFVFNNESDHEDDILVEELID
jgi:hypothetical protein